jgi:NCAIR mutase (PurE)-related protein
MVAPMTLSTLPSLREGLHWVAQHTGVPVILVAAVGIVVSWRIFKKTARIAVEVALVLVVLVIATKLGWISW